MLRATLRTPSFKHGQYRAFSRRASVAIRGRGQPRRGCRRPKPATRSGAGRLWSRRADGFLLHPFLSPSKEKGERPMGRQVPLPRRSRLVRPPAGGVLYDRVFCRRKQGAFHSPPALLRAALQKTSRRVGASIPPRQGFSYSSLTPLLAGAFLGANNRRGPCCRALRLWSACRSE